MTDFLWIIFFLSYFVVLNRIPLTVPFGSFINIYATQITIARAMTESPRKPSFIISAGAGEKYSAFSSAYSNIASPSHISEAPQNIQHSRLIFSSRAFSLLSIVSGTVVYMLLIQLVFAFCSRAKATDGGGRHS